MDNKKFEESLDESRKYRKDNFRVDVNREKRSSGFSDEFYLRVTHNGYQWSSLSLLPSEIDAVIKALKGVKSAKKKPRKNS